MKPKFVLVLIVYIAAIGAMAWYSRQKAVDFARQEQRRQEELGAGYTPSGPRLQAMSGIFNANPNGDPEAQAQGIAIAASQELSQRLVERLQAAMAEQGPVGAVNVCGDVAQQMTTDYNRLLREIHLQHVCCFYSVFLCACSPGVHPVSQRRPPPPTNF